MDDQLATVQRWLADFTYYYNIQRPNTVLDNCTPAQEVIK